MHKWRLTFATQNVFGDSFQSQVIQNLFRGSDAQGAGEQVPQEIHWQDNRSLINSSLCIPSCAWPSSLSFRLRNWYTTLKKKKVEQKNMLLKNETMLNVSNKFFMRK